jgi:hypothetical protein
MDETDLHAIEAEIGRRIVARYNLDLSGLVLDMTHFATFIDSANEAAPIAQRGKATQKRVDLRLVGLGLVVTRDGGIPLVSHAYLGDRPDVTQFPTLIDELVTRYRELADGVETLTLVYDARPPRPSGDRAHPLPQSRPGRFPGLTFLDTTATAPGVTRRAILTHSNTLHAAQSHGFDQTLAKAKAKARLRVDHATSPNTRIEAITDAGIDVAPDPTETSAGLRGVDVRSAGSPGTRAARSSGRQVVRSSMPVTSTTQAPSRIPPSDSIAGSQQCSGTRSTIAWIRVSTGNPKENHTPRSWHAAAKAWVARRSPSGPPPAPSPGHPAPAGHGRATRPGPDRAP